ncbi:hypothetical protein Clacol_000529 [Clathrus columnatus]|uniref:Uncharacterized protein n=1 Tax=Clathrus columnatus TaxID=1419009 RepID=A0AAV4ZZI9_9AGAM|nr:hypothetical protein Clacol_000529 [Clathrus columnatus]
MIILDSETQKPPLVRRTPSIVSNTESVLSSDVSPPSYRSQGSRHSIQPMYGDRPPSICDADIPIKPKRRLRLEQGWCWKGLLYVLLVYAVVSIAVAVPYFVTHHNSSASTTPYNRMSGKGNGSNDVGSLVTAPPNISAADGKIIACNSWDDTYAYGYPDSTESSRLTFTIPTNVTNLWLRSTGKIHGLTSGKLSVILNPDITQTQFLASVTVTYDADNDSARNSTAICLMQLGESWGIGFYSSSSKSWDLDLQYQITMYMPQIDDETLTISQLSIALPGFSQSFQDLEEYIAFDNVNISGESSTVDGTLSAKNINISTSHASITGNYSIFESLSLQTSSGIIDTDIVLAGGTQDIPTNLSIQSMEGPVSARITLSGPSATNTTNLLVSTPPWFQASVLGEDSAMTIILNHADNLSHSELNLNVNTSFNRALVLLDNKFQGEFSLRSINGSILVADIDATTNFDSGTLEGSFPSPPYYRRSLDIQTHSPTELYGVVRRDDGGEDSPNTGQTNVQIQNYLALVAFGFFQSGDPNPTLAELGLRP